MCQSIEDVDRISWEAEMMRAEEHFDSMDEDEDCAFQGFPSDDGKPLGIVINMDLVETVKVVEDDG